jgi:AcrR family transcriptional regulator
MRRLGLAAAELLAEVGPIQLSVRKVSSRAGENPGQVYHYFGSKAALLREGMHLLASDHQRRMRDARTLSSMQEDERYWRALGHAVLDGAEDLYRVEIEAGLSMPRALIEHKRAEAGGTLSPEQTARVVANIALALGWATFEPFIFALLQQDADHPSKEALRCLMGELLEERTRASPWE